MSDQNLLKAMASNAIDSLRGGLRRFIFPQERLYTTFGVQNIRQPTESKQRKHYKNMFFRALNIRAQKFAQGMMDAQVVRRIDQNEFEEVEADHPWVQKKNNPSPNVNAFEYWKWMSLSIDLVGHARSIVRSREPMAGAMQPTSFLPIYQMFGQLEPIPNREGGIDAWSFWRSDGQRKEYPHEDVITFDRLSPFDPYETISLVQAGMMLLDLDHFMKEYRKESVEKGGISSVVLASDETRVQGKQRDQMAQEFKQYMGTKGIDKALALSHGFKPVTFGIDARDLQYIEGSIQSKDDIFDFTGVPETLFSKEANRANVEGAERIFAQYTIGPELLGYCMQLTDNFERIFGADEGVLYVMPPDVAPVDEELEMRQRESKQRTGQRTINEFRAKDGKDPYSHPLADEPLVNASLIPLSQLEGPPTLNDQFTEPDDEEDPDEEDSERASLLYKSVKSRNGTPWGV